MMGCAGVRRGGGGARGSRAPCPRPRGPRGAPLHDASPPEGRALQLPLPVARQRGLAAAAGATGARRRRDARFGVDRFERRLAPATALGRNGRGGAGGRLAAREEEAGRRGEGRSLSRRGAAAGNAAVRERERPRPRPPPARAGGDRALGVHQRCPHRAYAPAHARPRRAQRPPGGRRPHGARCTAARRRAAGSADSQHV